ncbi:MAG TPA: SEC-C metal-binding domain-containing protein [Thermoanaerobaculia bacterium]|nr:SEC-C metal-binding domain-containing protein [Thermoanaerobaculia bacterium]
MSSKRRKGFPSETRVKRGVRIVHGDKELLEKLGRNDPCPCHSGRRFQELLPPLRPLRRHAQRPLLSADEASAGPKCPALCRFEGIRNGSPVGFA